MERQEPVLSSSISRGTHILHCSSENPQWDQTLAADSSNQLNNIPWSGVPSFLVTHTSPLGSFAKTNHPHEALLSHSALGKLKLRQYPPHDAEGRWELREERQSNRNGQDLDQGEGLLSPLTLRNVCVT